MQPGRGHRLGHWVAVDQGRDKRPEQVWSDPGGAGGAGRELELAVLVEGDKWAHHRGDAVAGRPLAYVQLAFTEHRIQVDTRAGHPDARAQPEGGRDHARVALVVDDGDVGGLAVAVG